MPSLFGWLQDRHGPMQAFAQQTPSTQKVEWHCALSVHGVPIARLHAPDASQLNASVPPPSPGASPPPSPRVAAAAVAGAPPSAVVAAAVAARAAALAGFATAGQSSIASGTLSPSPSAGTAAVELQRELPRDPPES